MKARTTMATKESENETVWAVGIPPGNTTTRGHNSEDCNCDQGGGGHGGRGGKNFVGNKDVIRGHDNDQGNG